MARSRELFRWNKFRNVILRVFFSTWVDWSLVKRDWRRKEDGKKKKNRKLTRPRKKKLAVKGFDNSNGKRYAGEKEP